MVKPRDTVLPDAGRKVLLGVRPEHLTLVSDSNNADFEMKVTTVETLGADTLAHGYPVGGNARGSEMIARLPGGARVSDGDVLPLAINPGAAHLFDAGSGKRV